jgi:hypothetical protein
MVDTVLRNPHIIVPLLERGMIGDIGWRWWRHQGAGDEGSPTGGTLRPTWSQVGMDGSPIKALSVKGVLAVAMRTRGISGFERLQTNQTDVSTGSRPWSNRDSY